MSNLFVRVVCCAALAACSSRDVSVDSAEEHNPLLNSATQVRATELVVSVSGGAIQGKLDGDTRWFTGIPYAAPPTGPLRFAPPEAAQPWKGVRAATEFGLPCVSANNLIASEDCLTLNVFAPTHAAALPMPVLVFVHGGGFSFGSSAEYSALMTSLQGTLSGNDVGLPHTQSAIVVTINYRLGPLGFMADPAIDASIGTTSGNMGLRDQQFALRWVRENIAGFGGDPQRITLFGQSAGGASVCLQMFVAGAESLAQRYIIQSGSCTSGVLAPVRTREVLQAESRALIDQLCPGRSDTLACLRELPADAFAGGLSTSWFPHIDGDFLRDAPIRLLRAGQFVHAPVLLGTARNEVVFFDDVMGITPHPSTLAELHAALRTELWPIAESDAEAAAISAHYATTATTDMLSTYRKILNDSVFHCPARELARGLVNEGVPTWLYSFEVPPAAHTQDVDYVFGFSGVGISTLLLVADPPAPMPLLPNVVAAMQNAWGSFARHGDPGAWPAYDLSTQQHNVFAPAPAVAGDTPARAADCDFWDALYAAR